MSNNLLLYEDAQKLVENCIVDGKDKVVSTQAILDSGAVPALKGFRVKPGKVSDSIFGGAGSYTVKDGARVEFENPRLETSTGLPVRLMVRTPRISTHDINRGEVPFKDQVLAVNHNFMRRMLIPFIGTSQFEVPGLDDNAVVITAENLRTIPYENVLRAFMAKTTTSTLLYQAFMAGRRVFCGHRLPDNLVTNGPLPYIMDTPSTKSDTHDESLSQADLLEKGIATAGQYIEIRNGSLAAFGAVSNFLGARGIIAVDTKTEHGTDVNGRIKSQDEIWTMDSSRFWLAEDYAAQTIKYVQGQLAEIDPRSFSKEFARGMSKGTEGYTDVQRAEIAVRYIIGIQHLTGKRFTPDLRSHEERVVSGLEKAVEFMRLI